MSKEFKLIENIITKVYIDRYKGLNILRKRNQEHQKPDPVKISGLSELELPEEPLNIENREKAGTRPERIIEETGSELRDGSLIVEWETFQNLCLDALKGTLGRKLNLITASDDVERSKYLYKTFRNLLQTEIYKLTPGLETRVKQIKKIFSVCCDQIEFNHQVCWKLKNLREKEGSPAGLDQLEKTVHTLKAPELHFPKKSNSKQGPSISEKAMRTYLLTLLQKIGGAVIENDLITFIRKLYGLESIKQIGFSSSTSDGDEKNGISEDKWLSYQSYKEGDFLLSPAHRLMAQEIFNRFTPRMKEIFKFIYIENMGVKQAGKKMNCSLGTITNITNEIKQVFIAYFNSDNNPLATWEEVQAVYALVADLILEEKINP